MFLISTSFFFQTIEESNRSGPNKPVYFKPKLCFNNKIGF